MHFISEVREAREAAKLAGAGLIMTACSRRGEHRSGDKDLESA